MIDAASEGLRLNYNFLLSKLKAILKQSWVCVTWMERLLSFVDHAGRMLLSLMRIAVIQEREKA